MMNIKELIGNSLVEKYSYEKVLNGKINQYKSMCISEGFRYKRSNDSLGVM